MQRNQGIAVGTRFFMLGVLAEVLIRRESGRLEFIDAPTAMEPVVRTKQMLDLGVVVKASCIIDAIELLLREHGEIK